MLGVASGRVRAHPEAIPLLVSTILLLLVAYQLIPRRDRHESRLIFLSNEAGTRVHRRIVPTPKPFVSHGSSTQALKEFDAWTDSETGDKGIGNVSGGKNLA